MRITASFSCTKCRRLEVLDGARPLSLASSSMSISAGSMPALTFAFAIFSSMALLFTSLNSYLSSLVAQRSIAADYSVELCKKKKNCLPKSRERAARFDRNKKHLRKVQIQEKKKSAKKVHSAGDTAGDKVDEKTRNSGSKLGLCFSPSGARKDFPFTILSTQTESVSCDERLAFANYVSKLFFKNGTRAVTYKSPHIINTRLVKR